MSTAIISRRYSKALLSQAGKEKAGSAIEEVGAGLDALADAMVENQAFLNALTNPKVPRAAKENILTETLKLAKAHKLVETFVRLVLSKNRITLLDEMRKVYHTLADEKLGRAQAQVKTAMKMTGPQEKALADQLKSLTGKEVTLHITEQPELLGGVVAQVGSTVWDGSLRTQLNQIHKQMIEG